jgi:hypothetical protein
MQDYLSSVIKRFQSYKTMGENTFAQLSDKDLFWQYNAESNSIAIIVQHMAGNMLSRWTDFLTTDGEKLWRTRDSEFETKIATREELLRQWNAGWDCLLNTLNSLTDDDLHKTVLIRNEPHGVIDAINRQLSHYPYHVGQIVFIGKMLSGEKWQSLSIAKGQSETFNAQMFNK